MNVYLRNGIIAVIINMVIFIIGWGCIVPDQLVDNTHIFGLVGSVELVKGNTAVVFGMCASLSTLWSRIILDHVASIRLLGVNDQRKHQRSQG